MSNNLSASANEVTNISARSPSRGSSAKIFLINMPDIHRHTGALISLPLQSTTMHRITRQIKERAISLGFERVGVTHATLPNEDENSLMSWLDDGFAANMEWMKKDPKRRVRHSSGLNEGASCDPQLLPQGIFAIAGCNQHFGLRRKMIHHRLCGSTRSGRWNNWSSCKQMLCLFIQKKRQ